MFFEESEFLFPTTYPDGLADEVKFPNRSVGFECEWTLPTIFESKNDDFEYWRTEEYEELLSRLCEGSSNDSRQIHRAGGHPQEVQCDIRLECQLVTNGIYCGNPSGYKDPRRAELEKGALDWRLLVQFDSDEDKLGWMWGDVGRVYFWARQQDIDATDFNNSWAILQCG